MCATGLLNPDPEKLMAFLRPKPAKMTPYSGNKP